MKESWFTITVIPIVFFLTAAFSTEVEVPGMHNQAFLISPEDSAYLDSIALWHMTTYHAPGLTDLIIKDGEIIWIGHYGFANIEQQLPPNDSTSWDAGSIAKTVTAVAAMKAWEDGHYGLDDDINDYLQFSVTNPYFPNDSITQLMLLCHQGSMYDWNIPDLLVYTGDPEIQLDTVLYNYLNPNGYWYNSNNYLSYSPGSNCDYSNVGIGLAGYLTQVVTGDSLPLYCRENIFEPLGMNHTSWWYSELDTNNVAMKYNYTGGGYVRCGGTGISSHPNYPPGILKFSAIDLARFLLAFVGYGELNGVRILDSTTVELMRTVQDTIIFNQWPCQICITWWHFYSPSTGSWCWGHAGQGEGCSGTMIYYEDEDIGVIILSNGEINALLQLLPGMSSALCQWAMQYGIAENTIEPAHIVKLEVTPNPFTHTTNIRYTMQEVNQNISGSAGRTSEYQKPDIKIFDACGRLVKSIRTTPNALRSTLSWNGRDDQNRMLGSGVYFIKLTSGNMEEVKKVLLVR